MPINFEKFYKNISNLYNDIKRLQVNVDDSLAVTLSFIYNCYTIKILYASNEDKGQHAEELKKTPDWYKDSFHNEVGCDFITNNTAEFLANKYIEVKQYISNVPKEIIKRSIEKLIEQNSQFLQPSSQKTSTSTEKIIRTIAKKLPVKIYMDIAIGTGSLLTNLDGEIYGSDINPRMAIIAKIYLYFCDKNIHLGEHNEDYENIQIDDSIENYIQYNKKEPAVVIFDPPMGDYRKYPQIEEWQQTSVLESKKLVKLQSELLFLLSFLINAENDDYFIGLFPENILTKNNKDYNSIRKYLIENSLIAVIKVLEPHVLLIGKKKLNTDKYKEIPVIRIQSILSEEQLDFISSELIKGEDFDFESDNKDFRNITRVVYNRKDFKDNYIINLPLKISYEDTYKNQIKSPKELLNSLQEKENTIKSLMQNLSENIANTELYSEDAKENRELLWFEKYDEKQDPELINALNYFYRIGYQLNSSNINDYHDFQIRENINADSYNNLKILYKDGRVKLLKNKAKIYFDKNEKLKIKKIDLSEFYKSFEPLQAPNVSKILDMVAADNNIRLVFEDLCKYYMLDQNEDDTLLKQKKFPIKEFTRCLKVLENLGLIIFDKRKVLTSEQGHSDVDLYRRSFPNIKYLNAIKFEESQNVR